jgi:uncharacterized membrane protein
MKALRATLLGGVVFLFPVVVLLVVIGQAIEWIRLVSDPIAASLPGDVSDWPVMTHLAAISILLLGCLVAGLLARGPSAKRFVDFLEESILRHLPFYDMLKARADSIQKPTELHGMDPVVVRFDDSWQIAFEIERVEGGAVALYVPGSPDPWSGGIMVVEEDRVSPLNLTVPLVAKLSQRLGKGTNDALAEYFLRER